MSRYWYSMISSCEFGVHNSVEDFWTLWAHDFYSSLFVIQTNKRVYSYLFNYYYYFCSLCSISLYLCWLLFIGLSIKDNICLCRLLDPNLESSGSLFVASYILQLILYLPSQMAQHIRDLVAALVRRMESCQIAGLKSSLILIFARLVYSF